MFHPLKAREPSRKERLQQCSNGKAAYAVARFLSSRIAQSGQTVWQIPQAIQLFGSLILIAGVPKKPSRSDQSITSLGHFSLHSPHPLHRVGKTYHSPLGTSILMTPLDFTPTTPCSLSSLLNHFHAAVQSPEIQVPQCRILAELVPQFFIQDLLNILQGHYSS